MVLIILFLFFEIRTHKTHFNSDLFIDFEEIDLLEQIREEKEKEIQELIEKGNLTENELSEIERELKSNMAVNELSTGLNEDLRDDKAEKADDLYEMAKRLQQELDATNKAFEELKDFGAIDKTYYDTLTKEPITKFYKGPTNISYELKDRFMAKLEVPVYKCEGGGTVVVLIEVNQKGYVVNVKIDVKNSELNDCFVESATNAAYTTRFNPSETAPDLQKGKITYRFVSQ